mmetsp:Transcript_15286/g.17622  ORF Transcript_15286/g.17622 Transcript_15286/m.17622 type:complete len:106 (+) Transcript_15286:632-949(+)
MRYARNRILLIVHYSQLPKPIQFIERSNSTSKIVNATGPDHISTVSSRYDVELNNKFFGGMQMKKFIDYAKVCIHPDHPTFKFNTPYYIFSLQIKENENSEYHSI